ncbi:MAG: hypothetical protein WKF93_04220 [Acidimicrobiales bacterium]
MVSVDITCDLMDEDETGYVWTFLRDARNAALIEPALSSSPATRTPPLSSTSSTSRQAPSCHLRVLPGVTEDYEALIRRATPSA